MTGPGRPSIAALALAAAVALLASCVPASDEEPPAGAAGFTTEPSPATRGEPFTTDDGWVIRIESVVASAWVDTSPPSGSYDGRQYASGGWLFDAAVPTALFASGASVGPVFVAISLRGNFIYEGREDTRDRRRVAGVSPAMVERFNRAPDEGFDDFYGGYYERSPSGYGPSIALVARAEKGERVERIEFVLGLTTYGGSSSDRWSVDVKEDALATVPLLVSAEALFRDAEGRSSFDELAAADANGDGLITTAELLATPAKCNCPVTAPAHPGGEVRGPDLVDLLERNASSFFAVPR